MGLPVQGHAAVAVDDLGSQAAALIHLVDVAGDIIEALRPEEEAVPVVALADGSQVLPQLRVGLPGGEAEIPGAALRIEAAGHGDGLQKRGLPAAVLPYQKRYRPVEAQLVSLCQIPDRGKVFEVAPLRQLPLELHAAQILHQRLSCSMELAAPPGTGRCRC